MSRLTGWNQFELDFYVSAPKTTAIDGAHHRMMVFDNRLVPGDTADFPAVPLLCSLHHHSCAALPMLPAVPFLAVPLLCSLQYPSYAPCSNPSVFPAQPFLWLPACVPCYALPAFLAVP